MSGLDEFLQGDEAQRALVVTLAGGLTLRDYFAAHAHPADRETYSFLSDPSPTTWRYRYADMMLKERTIKIADRF